MTNYLDTHIEWMQDHGVDIKPIDDVPTVETPPDLPREADLWFSYRMPHRVEPLRAVGYQNMAAAWHKNDHHDLSLLAEDPRYPDPDLRELTEQAREAGTYPHQPIGLAWTQDYLSVVWETQGKRAGWLYRVGDEGPADSEPIAPSLSQWFQAVRALTAAGVFEPAAEEASSPYYHKPGATVQAPADTPNWLLNLGETSHPFGDQRGISPMPQLENSITELLPNFDWVHPITPLNQL